MDKSVKVTNFEKIKNANELQSYLRDMTRRLDNTKMVCQYTGLRAALSIISKKYWYLGNPKNMNDGLEIQQGLDTRDNIFFSSFMIEKSESVAMWSMYAQPWEDGVMISIPKAQFKKWKKDIRKIYSADPQSKKVDENMYVELDKAEVSVTRVAYIKQDINGKIEKISCGGAKNDLLKSINAPSLIGYIKDDAWSYEKEIRLRVDLDQDIHYEGIAVDVPDYIIDSMVITKGPRFNGDLMERIKVEVDREIKTQSSSFYEKLNYTPCDGCAYRNGK
jgi:hypothetical protein